jgi:hypothetical protein
LRFTCLEALLLMKTRRAIGSATCANGAHYASPPQKAMLVLLARQVAIASFVNPVGCAKRAAQRAEVDDGDMNLLLTFS